MRAALMVLLAVCFTVSCTPDEQRPNVLWIVWDTVRADHLSLYGYERPTTPNLDAFAASARVFDNCLSASGYTLPSHASMFTGLLPGEHCTDNRTKRLDDSHTTIAELLQASGYRTFLYSANPHVSHDFGNLAQGFEAAEHPWSPSRIQRAASIVRQKIPDEDLSSELAGKFQSAENGLPTIGAWNVTASGTLAGQALLGWLDDPGTASRKRPFFAFLNYMEAHRPLVPARPNRERVMTPAQVAQSYRVDRSWLAMWEYTFGLRDYSDAELDLTRATYDAALTELDDLFGELMQALDERGLLDDTIVILTADHGEHLGEQHMFDHQYSLYQPLLDVPLVLRYPGSVEPGRDDRPVMNFDLFPTVLELVGLEPPDGWNSLARSLLDARSARIRIAEDPSGSEVGIQHVHDAHPGWDPAPWRRKLSALVDGSDKVIASSTGKHELYDIVADPLETTDLSAEQEEKTLRLGATLHGIRSEFEPCDVAAGSYDTSPELLEMLKALGYAD